jgi:hypothetical protein
MAKLISGLSLEEILDLSEIKGEVVIKFQTETRHEFYIWFVKQVNLFYLKRWNSSETAALNRAEVMSLGEKEMVNFHRRFAGCLINLDGIKEKINGK